MGKRVRERERERGLRDEKRARVKININLPPSLSLSEVKNIQRPTGTFPSRVGRAENEAQRSNLRVYDPQNRLAGDQPSCTCPGGLDLAAVDLAVRPGTPSRCLPLKIIDGGLPSGKE